MSQIAFDTASSAALRAHSDARAGDQLYFESLPRKGLISASLVSSGLAAFTFFTQPYRSTQGLCSKFLTATDGSVASGVPTVAKIGLYTSDGTTLTRVAVTAHTAGLWSTAYTPYETSMLVPYTPVSGQRYAAAVLLVTAGSIPTLIGYGTNSNVLRAGPILCSAAPGQTDLAASYTIASLDFHYLMHFVGGIA